MFSNLLDHVLPSKIRLARFAIVLVMAETATASTPTTWERLAPLPVGNGGFVSAVIDNQIVIAGGTTWKDDTKIWLDQIWTFDPGRNQWREVGRLSTPFAYGVTGQDGGTLWFASGSSGTTTHRSLWRMGNGFKPQVVAPLDRGVVYAASALIGSTLYAVGGTDDQAGLERVGNTLLAIDVKSGAIKRLPDYPESGLTTGTAAAVGDRIFVFGGARWDPVEKKAVNHSSAHAYSVTKKRWESLPPLPYPGRGYFAVKLDERHILVAGGYRNDAVEFVADAFVYNVDSRTYTATKPLPYAAMVSLVKSGDWLYCIGGEDRKRHRSDAFYRIRWRELLPDSR